MGNNFGPKNSNWKGGKHTFICEYCGKEFKKYLCGRPIARFCSNICAHASMPVQNKGKHLSAEHRHKLKLAKLGKKLSKTHKQKLRESLINYNLHRLGYKYPCVGWFEPRALNILEKCFGFNILRQYKVAGYFLDGYCPTLNLAIEIDEPRHLKSEVLAHDNEKEKNIKEVLGCKFLRVRVPSTIYYQKNKQGGLV